MNANFSDGLPVRTLPEIVLMMMMIPLVPQIMHLGTNSLSMKNCLASKLGSMKMFTPLHLIAVLQTIKNENVKHNASPMKLSMYVHVFLFLTS